METHDWDGIERRQLRHDEEMIKLIYDMMSKDKDKDITHSTLQMKDLWAIIAGIGTVATGCFFAWNNLNNAITINEHQFELFKTEMTQTTKNISDLEKKVHDLETQTKELDSTLNQLYNKLNKTHINV